MGTLEGQGGNGHGATPAEPRRYRMFIDARRPCGRSGRVAPSAIPARERTGAGIQDARDEDVDQAVTAASRAFDGGLWRRKSATRHGGMPRRIAERLAAAQEPAIRRA